MGLRQPGVYFDMSAEEYHMDPAPVPSLNQSLIPLLLRRSPRHAAYAHPRLNPYGPASQSSLTQYLGESVHRMALGRGREISAIRYPDYISSSAREARDAAIANGRIPVLERELVKARDMAVILREQIQEACEGHPYSTEVVVIWVEQTIHGPIYCRSQVDVWCPALRLALDPKALRIPATAEAFGRTAIDSGYDLQAVMYPRGLEKALPDGGGKVRFANLVVENFPPHGSQAFEPDESTRYIAERQVAEAMELFARCLYARDWPGYPKGIRPYTTPVYYQNSVINR